MKLESWSAWSAFASLQATAKNFAGMNNARMLIGEARNIRRLRYEQIAEEAELDQLKTEAKQKESSELARATFARLHDEAAYKEVHSRT
jgi:hypothetical protein